MGSYIKTKFKKYFLKNYRACIKSIKVCQSSQSVCQSSVSIKCFNQVSQCHTLFQLYHNECLKCEDLPSITFSCSLATNVPAVKSLWTIERYGWLLFYHTFRTRCLGVSQDVRQFVHNFFYVIACSVYVLYALACFHHLKCGIAQT